MVSSLWKACQEGDAARIDELLADPSQDIEIKDHNGLTPLILAIKGGHSTIVQALLNRGADPNNASAQGRPETYTTDPYILQLLAVARGEIAPYPEPTMHHQYYPYSPYYPYVQDSSWYLPHHPQHTTQREDHQSDPTDPTSNPVATTTNVNSANPSSNTTVSQPSHPSLPPPEIARNIPCRYFPACRYGSSCLFLHPTTPYFQGPLPPPAQYPHMYYPPLAYPLQGTAPVAAGRPASAPVDSDDASAQPSTSQLSSSDQNGEPGSDIPQNATAATPADTQQSEGGVSASGEAVTNVSHTPGTVVTEGGSDHVRSPTTSMPYAHPGMIYMYPPIHPPPHSQDGSQMHVPPLGHQYYPPVPGAALPSSHPHPLSQPQSTIPLPPPPQHIIPPPPPATVSQENSFDQQQSQQPSHQSQLLPENHGQQPQLPTTQQGHPSHVMPYPSPSHIYPGPLHPPHASWSHLPPPPPPHHHHQPQLHPGVHPHHHMHPGTSIPPPHHILPAGMPIHSAPVPGPVIPAPPGPTSGPPGSFLPRGGGGGRGGRRASAAFRSDRDRDRDRGEGRDRGDRDRDRDRDRSDRFGSLNGHYHHGGPHSSRKALCMFFPNGKCRNGDGCRFSHVLPDPTGSVSPLSPDGPPSGHRHSQSLSYRRSNYANGHHPSNTGGLVNGVTNMNNVDSGEAQQPPHAAAGAGIGTSGTGGSTSAGVTSSVPTVDEILSAMTLDSADPPVPGRRQHSGGGGGGRRGKHHGQHVQGGGYSHGPGHLNHRSMSASPSRGGQQQRPQQRIPTADDFPVLGGGSSINGAGSSAATSATGRTTPIHSVSNGTSNACGNVVSATNAATTNTTATATVPIASPWAAAAGTATGHSAINGWSTPIVNGGAVRLTAAQVVKEGMVNGHGHLGAWGKAPPPSAVNAEREPKIKEKEKEVREKETAMKEVKITV